MVCFVVFEKKQGRVKHARSKARSITGWP